MLWKKSPFYQHHTYRFTSAPYTSPITPVERHRCDDASTGAQRDPRPGLRRVAAGGAGTVDHETDAHEAGATDIRKVVLLL